MKPISVTSSLLGSTISVLPVLSVYVIQKVGQGSNTGEGAQVNLVSCLKATSC